MFGFLGFEALKSWYDKRMKFLRLASFTLCFASFMVDTAKAETVIVENFLGSACAALSQHQANMKALKQLHNDEVLMLTCPFDDTIMGADYPLKACSSRMSGYLRRDIFSGSSMPVIALNGRYVTAGGHQNIIASGITMAKTTDQISDINFRIENTDLVGTLPEDVAEGDYDLWLFAYDRAKVGSLEVFLEPEHTHNEDGTHVDPIFDNNEEAHQPITDTVDVTYDNFVRALKKLGDWSGNPESFVIPLNGFDAEGFVVVAQEKNYGPIVAYGHIERDINPPNQ